MLPEVTHGFPAVEQQPSALVGGRGRDAHSAHPLTTPGPSPDLSSPHRTPLREALADLPVALLEAIAKGTRLYVPAAVGAAVNGGLAFTAAVLGHFVLGVEGWLSGVSFAAAIGAICGHRLLAERIRSQ